MDDEWDRRRWELALKTDKPVDSYIEATRLARDAQVDEKIDELPPEQQSWLRAR